MLTRLLIHPLFGPLLYLGVRAALSPLSPVPGGLVLDPLWVFLALRGEQNRWTRGASLLPGLILGDWLAGLDPVVMLVRAIGMFSVLGTEDPEAGPHARWLVGTVFFSVWSAVAVDMTGFYPLGFLSLLGLVQSLLWWGLAAPNTGGGPLPPFRQWLWLPLLLGLAHLVFPAPPLLPLPYLGDTSGWAIRTVAILLVLMPWGPPLWRLREKIRPEPERKFQVMIE